MGRSKHWILSLALVAGACGGEAADATSGAATTEDAADTGPAAPTSSSTGSTGAAADDTDAGTGTGQVGSSSGVEASTSGPEETGGAEGSTSGTTGEPGGTTGGSTSGAEDPSCSNGVQDVGESDVDCGGSACPGCLEGQVCSGNLDCAAYACMGGVCVAPECTFKDQCKPEGCALAACDALTFECSFVPVGEGELCDDGDECTHSRCISGVCTIEEVFCNGPGLPAGPHALAGTW